MFLFLSAYFLTFPALLAFLFFGVIFSSNDMHKMTVFSGIVAGVIAVFMFGVTINTALLFSAVYLIVGIVWSFWRYKRYADNLVDFINASNSSYDIKLYTSLLDPKNIVGKITSWILTWPFSMIENVVGDVVRLINNLVTDTLTSIYNKIHSSATSKIIKKDI